MNQFDYPDKLGNPANLLTQLPMFEETPKEKLNNLFKMMESKGPEILKQDPYYEYYKVAQRAKEQGLIRKKTQEEIDEELKKKPWLK